MVWVETEQKNYFTMFSAMNERITTFLPNPEVILLYGINLVTYSLLIGKEKALYPV